MAAMTTTGGENAMRLFNRGIGVVVNYFSSEISTVINAQPARVEITVIVLVVFAMWAFADPSIRKAMARSVLMKENMRWRDVIIEMLDAILLLGIFLVTQLIIAIVREITGSSESNATESFVLVPIALLSGFSLLHLFRELTGQK